ncbi:MAG: hypothetical protein LBR33_02080 [Propionibacteriaceae bacterium]|jgi:hypothetical protein|nr:hypothetical protein [Propionibacteriaceae bacterium]
MTDSPEAGPIPLTRPKPPSRRPIWVGAALAVGLAAVVVGESTPGDADLPGDRGEADALVARYASDGGRSWLTTFGGSGLDRFWAVVPTGGQITAVGAATSGDGDLPGNYGQSDALLVAYSVA